MGIQNLNIEAFKSVFKRGARPNLFYVEIEAPSALRILGVDIPDLTFSYLCKSAKIPAFKVGDVDVNYMGHKIPRAGDPSHEHSMPLTIINDEDYKVKNFMDKWVQLVRHPLYGTSTSPDIYSGSATIVQLDGIGNPIRAVKLFDAYAQDSGEVELSWDNENQIETFNATLRYAYPANVNLVDFSLSGLVKLMTGV